MKASAFVIDSSKVICSAQRGRLSAILLRMGGSDFCAMTGELPAGILEAYSKGKEYRR